MRTSSAMGPWRPVRKNLNSIAVHMGTYWRPPEQLLDEPGELRA